MLHPIAFKSRRCAVIKANWARHRDRSLRQQLAGSYVVWYPQIIAITSNCFTAISNTGPV